MKPYRQPNGARLIFAALLLSTGLVAATPELQLSADPFLRPYVAQIKAETPTKTLDTIRTMAERDLISLHLEYGMWIRNRWLRRSDRDPALLQFFLDHGVNHPDNMSTVLVHALWTDLNSNLTADEKAGIAAKRATVAAKRSTYDKLSSECATHLADSKADFERCYRAHGLPSKNPLGRNPFFKLVISKTGSVQEIVFFEGASTALKSCLRPALVNYRFSPFAYDETLTLYIVDYPYCRVEQQDDLFKP